MPAKTKKSVKIKKPAPMKINLCQEDLDRFVSTVRDGLSGETDNKGVESFYFPYSETQIIGDELAVQIKLFITWRQQDVFLYIRSRKKETSKATALEPIGTVESIRKKGDSFVVSFKGPTSTATPKRDLVVKEASE